MKILLGVTAALAVVAGVLSWQLREALQDAESHRLAAERANRSVAEQRQQSELLWGRLDALDRSLKGLAEDSRQNARQLEQTLAAIDGITKSEGDTDESMACLGVRIPRQLDRSLH